MMAFETASFLYHDGDSETEEQVTDKQLIKQCNTFADGINK